MNLHTESVSDDAEEYVRYEKDIFSQNVKWIIQQISFLSG